MTATGVGIPALLLSTKTTVLHIFDSRVETIDKTVKLLVAQPRRRAIHLSHSDERERRRLRLRAQAALLWVRKRSRDDAAWVQVHVTRRSEGTPSLKARAVQHKEDRRSDRLYPSPPCSKFLGLMKKHGYKNHFFVPVRWRAEQVSAS